MRVLHMLRSEPDQDVLKLKDAFSDWEETTIALYDDNVNWDTLVDDIYSSDTVISWW